MKTLFYICWIRLDSFDRFLIWSSNNEDGVVLNEDGKIPLFESRSRVEEFAGKKGIVLESDEPILHNLDLVKHWLDRPSPESIDCNEMLAVWNLFDDIARSVDRGLGVETSALLPTYDDLFFGADLLANRSEMEKYTPVFSEEQVLILQQVLANGMKLLRDHGEWG